MMFALQLGRAEASTPVSILDKRKNTFHPRLERVFVFFEVEGWWITVRAEWRGYFVSCSEILGYPRVAEVRKG